MNRIISRKISKIQCEILNQAQCYAIKILHKERTLNSDLFEAELGGGVLKIPYIFKQRSAKLFFSREGIEATSRKGAVQRAIATS